MNDRQKYILDFALQKQDFQTKDILEFLQSQFYVQRITVVRDLKFLVENNYLVKKWSGASVRYCISQTHKVLEDIDVEEYFSTPYDKRQALHAFNFEVFDTLKQVSIFSKEEIQKLEGLQKEFVANISQYDSQTLINKEYERIMIEFSWKSSSIEWNTYSLLATEALLKENIADESKTKEETQMILNHKDAFNTTLMHLDVFQKLSVSNIEHIHQILTKKLGIGANIRKHTVWITGTNYKPLDNEFQIKEALQNMVELINYKQNFFEKAFLSLLFISYIQAFEDGNKRTARMVANALLLAYNSIPLSYRWVDIMTYKKATLLFYERNNIVSFKKIFIEQFEDAVRYYFH